MLARLFKAEIYKILGHRWATGMFVWIFPVGAAGFLVIMFFIALLSPNFRADVFDEPASWTETMMSAWSFPTNPVGRLFLLGFIAVLFGGEYQWNTWKAIVPRSWRVPLILVKFTAMSAVVVFAFVLMSLVLTLGIWLGVIIFGGEIGPSLTGEVLTDFAGDYATQMFTAFTSVAITAGYAAVAAMITRSILGSVIAGFVVTIAEGASIAFFALADWILGTDHILGWYRVMPTYNLINVGSWINDNEAAAYELRNNIDVSYSLETSLVVLVVWVFGLLGLTAYFFQRQDITN